MTAQVSQARRAATDGEGLTPKLMRKSEQFQLLHRAPLQCNTHSLGKSRAHGPNDHRLYKKFEHSKCLTFEMSCFGRRNVLYLLSHYYAIVLVSMIKASGDENEYSSYHHVLCFSTVVFTKISIFPMIKFVYVRLT